MLLLVCNIQVSAVNGYRSIAKPLTIYKVSNHVRETDLYYNNEKVQKLKTKVASHPSKDSECPIDVLKFKWSKKKLDSCSFFGLCFEALDNLDANRM